MASGGWIRFLLSRRRSQISDLCNAVHNIPGLLLAWERCSEPSLRRDLESYDTRWATAGFGLLGAYEDGLRGDLRWLQTGMPSATMKAIHDGIHAG